MIQISDNLIRRHLFTEGQGGHSHSSSFQQPPFFLEEFLSSSPPVSDTFDNKLPSPNNHKDNEEDIENQIINNNDKKDDIAPCTKIVKFTESKSSSFIKETTNFSFSKSTLSLQLEKNASRQTPFISLSIFPHISPQDTHISQPVMKVSIKSTITVDDTIELILQQYVAEQQIPHLKYRDNSCYELRMIEDETGDPDEDMPALDRQSTISSMGIDSVALCIIPNIESKIKSLQNNLNTNSLGLLKQRALSKAQKFVKVYLSDHEYFILNINSEDLLVELLNQLSKKIKKPMDSADYFFCYHPLSSSEMLDMNMSVSNLQQDEIWCCQEQRSLDIETSNTNTAVNLTFMNSETAALYTEYNVIKTNKRGRKQTRILGISKNEIINKQPRELSFLPVKHSSRRICDITEMKVSNTNSLEFQIYIKEKDTITTMDYEAETTAERDEIVSKLNFLRMNKTMMGK